MFLLIDNYDSFTYNLVQAFYALGHTPRVLRNDDPAVLEAATDPELSMVCISPGPGHPADAGLCPEFLKRVDPRVPVLGVCLGHQLLALANGADTEKLKYGHRGANQPVKDLLTGRDYITSQNHGYAVKNDSLPDNAILRFINLNDGTCEGVSYQDFPGFSVQFHPEACGGPHDSEFLFREFVALMERRA